MIDSTNPRVMADNIRHLSGESGSQASDISDLQTTVGTQGNAIEALGSYSTTEVDTGMKWIDDSNIYRKVFVFESMPNNDTVMVNHNIENLGVVISIIGTIQPTASYPGRSFMYASTLYTVITTSKISVHTNSDMSDNSCYIIIEYTKSAPTPESLTSPSPEDETRSANDPEISDPIERSEEPSDEIIEEPIVETKTTRKKSTSTK